MTLQTLEKLRATGIIIFMLGAAWKRIIPQSPIIFGASVSDILIFTGCIVTTVGTLWQWTK